MVKRMKHALLYLSNTCGVGALLSIVSCAILYVEDNDEKTP